MNASELRNNDSGSPYPDKDTLKIYSDFFELSTDLIGIAGFDGRFLKLNPAFSKTLGVINHDFQTGKFFDFLLPEDRKRTQNFIQDLLSGYSVGNFINRYSTEDGVRWLEWSVI